MEQAVNMRKPIWPIFDRQVFYELLNIPGLLRNDTMKTLSVNTQHCLDDIIDMVTRMRIEGDILFEAITVPTQTKRQDTLR